jgi:hypothetical protein
MSDLTYPRLVTFQSLNAPPGGAWCGQFRVAIGKLADWHPVLFRGDTEAAVIAKAQAFWATETERFHGRAERRAAKEKQG